MKQRTLLTYTNEINRIETAKALIREFCAENKIKIKNLDLEIDLPDDYPCSFAGVFLSPVRNISLEYYFRPKDEYAIIAVVQDDLKKLAKIINSGKDKFSTYYGWGSPINHSGDSPVIEYSGVPA